MPFDATDPKFATVAVIDAVLEFFGDGRPWTKGELHDGHGNRCLLGAALRRYKQIFALFNFLLD